MNGQFYNDYSVDAYNIVVQNGYDPCKIVMGTMDPDVEDVVRDLAISYENKFGGVFFWEYPFVEPDPLTWAKTMHKIMNPGCSVKTIITDFINKIYGIFN